MIRGKSFLLTLGVILMVSGVEGAIMFSLVDVLTVS